MVIPKFAILIFALALVVSFQNCGNNMKFEQDGALVAKADVDTNGDGIPDDIINGGDGVGVGDGGVVVPPSPVVGQPPAASPSPAPSATPRPPYAGNPPRPGYDDDDDYDDDDYDDDDKDCKDDKDRGHTHGKAASYVCILEGPGKSVKLNYVPEAGVYADESASKAACMSANACLQIASKAFNVKSVERRGFCKTTAKANSGHVVLSDKQVEDAVAKANLLKLISDKD